MDNKSTGRKGGQFRPKRPELPEHWRLSEFGKTPPNSKGQIRIIPRSRTSDIAIKGAIPDRYKEKRTPKVYPSSLQKAIARRLKGNK